MSKITNIFILKKNINSFKKKLFDYSLLLNFKNLNSLDFLNFYSLCFEYNIQFLKINKKILLFLKLKKNFFYLNYFLISFKSLDDAFKFYDVLVKNNFFKFSNFTLLVSRCGIYNLQYLKENKFNDNLVLLRSNFIFHLYLLYKKILFLKNIFIIHFFLKMKKILTILPTMCFILNQSKKIKYTEIT